MFETSKGVLRRLHDSRFATRFFVGDGIDIGGGNDVLGQYSELYPLMRSCRAWDLKDGDAQLLAAVPDDSLDFAYSSHTLEHMRDPREALKHWLRVLKPGGHLIVVVPDEDLYEQGVFPSTFNTDHKWTFTMHKAASWSHKSVNLMALLGEFADRAQTIKVEQLDATFRFKLARFDQTQTPIGECGLEFVLRKLLPGEQRRRGRYPDAAGAPAQTKQPARNALYAPWLEPAGEFAAYYSLAQPRTLVSADRCHVLFKLALQALQLEGDFWECGVYRGGTAAMLAQLLADKQPRKKLYLFDTFAGMPQIDPQRDLHTAGDFADTSAEAVAAYVGHPELAVVRKGLIPQTFAGLESARIALAHVDVDIYRSVKDSLEFIWPRLSKGGFVVCDDYGFPTCPGAREAVDEFFAGNAGAQPLCLPTGQALIFKS